MTERDSVKAKEMPRLVGVITSRGGLRIAARLRKPPDLFELRLDHFADVADDVENMIPRLPSPLIITARDFREGGAMQLNLRERRNLLLRFLPHATFVDIELRSLHALAAVFETAYQRKVQRILSVHEFRSTPGVRTMLAKARAAKAAGTEIFKIMTRVDTTRQLARLVEFMERRPTGIEISAMGVGRLGIASRIVLSRLGSVMTYAHLGKTTLEGQPSLSQVRRLLEQPLHKEFLHLPVSVVRI
ncbi:MAG: type I 3-dehydroquinate dehydratase [Verrucomicrobiota bacterium]